MARADCHAPNRQGLVGVGGFEGARPARRRGRHALGRTPIDGPEESDAVAFRRALALEEVNRLKALCDEALSPLDEMERRQALAGDVALLSRPAKLVLRYEREAWRRYRESIREVGVPTPAPNPTPGIRQSSPLQPRSSRQAPKSASGR